MKVYLAGAHSRATTMAHYLTYLNPDIRILAYLYDNDEENPTEIDGVPVVRINENSILDTDAPVYLGTRGVNHAHLTATLTKCGMKQIIPVDVKLDMDTRNEYLKKYYASVGREYVKIDDLLTSSIQNTDKAAAIFVATSSFDKPLSDSEAYVALSCEKILQVGTALSSQPVQADYFDNIGGNISDLNAQFCELTGLYWIWKNADFDVVGLEHYRRHFILSEDWMNRMTENNIDVILPVPLYVSPSLAQNYKDRHIEEDWIYLSEYVKKHLSEEYDGFMDFFENTGLYSPCNMFIMKRDVLNELCSWMFPILFACADHIGEHEDKYQNRYPGFMSERLITYFFESRRNQYKVVYADKNFLN